MKYYLVSDNTDTLVGLRMAGIEGVVVHERDEVRAAVARALTFPDIGILLITEKLAALCPDLCSRLKLGGAGASGSDAEDGRRSGLPLLIEIPDRHGTGRSQDSITRYVREAIGVKV